METNKLSEEINQKITTAPPRGALKIGQATKKLGISIDTLRRWEEEGKITSIKSAGGTRYYNTFILRKIQNQLLKKHKAPTFINQVAQASKVQLPKISCSKIIYFLLIQVSTYKIILLPAIVFAFGLILLTGFLFKGTPDNKPLADQKTQKTAANLAAANQSQQRGEVLAAQTAKNYLNIKLDTIIKGDLTVGKVNGVTISGNMGPGQDLETTSDPTFSNINLTATSNQLAFGQGGVTGTLTWTPTSSAKIITLPDATTTLVGINTTQTITNKTISGSDNTISNIQSSALSGSYTGITGLGTIGTGTWNGSSIGTGYGGTGLTSYTIGDLIYSSASNTLKALPIGSSGQALKIVGGIPTWGEITTIVNLAGGAASVTGILPVGNGGTGASTLTGVLKGNGTSALTAMTGTTNYLTKWSDANTLSIGTIFDNGNVGIGTTNPSAALQVSGTTIIGPPTGAGTALTVKAAPSGSSNIFSVQSNDGSSTYFSVDSTGKLSSSAFQLTDINNAVVGTAIEGAWTMNSNTFSYRRIVTVTGDGSTTIPLNYEITLDLDSTASSQVYSKSQTDCDDVRVAYSTNGTTFTEIARNIDTCSSGDVVVKFQLQADIANGGSSSNYYLYYDNDSVSAGTTYDATDVTLDNADTVGNWTSSDAGYPLAQETTIVNQGTGSVKQGQTTAVSGNGDVGTFSTSGQAQMTFASFQIAFNHTISSGTTYVYVVTTGGSMGSSTNSTIYRSALDSSGNLSTAFDGTNQGPLPYSGVSAPPVKATIGGTTYVYLLGNGDSTVYKATIDDSSGNIGPFSKDNQTQLPVSSANHTAVTHTVSGTTYVYVLGAGTGNSTVYRASINSSGNIQTFSADGQSQLSTNVATHTSAKVTIGSSTYVYLIGGAGLSTVYRATIDSSGNIGPFSTDNQGVLGSTLRNPGVAIENINSNYYLYVAGGHNSHGGSMYSTVYKATIDGSGNVGTLSTANQGQLPVVVGAQGFTSATIGGTTYLYNIGGWSAGGGTLSTAYRANIQTAVTYTATKTFGTAQDLSNKGAITLDFRSSRTGSYMTFEFSNDGGTTWQSLDFSVSQANTWETKNLDISGIANASKNNVTKTRFRVTDTTSAFTAYFDNIVAKATSYSGSAPTIAAASAILGSSNLDINAQGSGIVRVNYDATNALAGTGGLTVYNGGTTSLFNIDSSGNLTAIGTTGATLSGAGAGLTFSGSGAHIISASSGTLALTTSDWGISATGVLTGISGITNDGAYTQSGVSANTFTGTSTFSNATYSALFTGGNVGIGTTAPTSPLAVTAPTTFTTGTLSSIIAPASTLTGALTGLNINVSGTTPGTQSVTALSTSAFTGGGNGTTNYGFNIGAVTGSGTSTNYGGYIGTISGGSTNNIGLRITGTAAAAANYGLYVDAAAQNYFAGNVGIGTTAPTDKLDIGGAVKIGSGYAGIGTTAPANGLLVQGNVGIGTTSPSAPLEVRGNGSIIAKFTDNNGTGCSLSDTGTLACSSDVNLKKNIDTISYGLDALMILNPVTYNWKTENDISTKSLGFIAQEVEKIIPNLVTTDSSTGFKQLNTIGLVPVLTKSIQEQQNEISSLNQKMLELEDKFALLTTTSSSKESTSSASENTPGVSPGQTTSEVGFLVPSEVEGDFSEVSLQLTPPEILLSTASAKLVNLEVTSDATISGKLIAYQGVVSDSFKSLGQTFLGNTTVVGGFSIDGTMSITGDSLNSIACTNTPGVGFNSPGVNCGTLFLQNSPLAQNLNIFNGEVMISRDGLVTIQGLAISSKTLGTITIPAGQSHLDIPNINLTQYSKVFTTINKPIPIGVQKDVEQQKIIITLDKAQSEDVQVDWWIIESVP